MIQSNHGKTTNRNANRIAAKDFLMESLPPRRSSARLRLLLTNTTQYINLLDETDIDMLLTSLAKTGGLTPADIQQHLETLYPVAPIEEG